MLRLDTGTKIVSWSGKTPFSIDTYDAIVISDYNKGFLTYEQIAKIISSSSGPVFIDTKKTQLADISARHV